MLATQRCLGAVVSLFLAAIAMLPAQEAARPVKFNKVSTRGSASAKDIRMVTAPAELLIDTIARRLEVKSKTLPLTISLDHVKRLTFDESTHMQSVIEGAGLLDFAMGAGKPMTEHWCVIEYVDDAGASRRYLLTIGGDQASDVLALLKQLVPSTIEEARFAEQPHAAADSEMAFNDEYDVTVVKENRPPIPPAHPDSALVVVAAPTVDKQSAGRGSPFRLYANRRIVAVNKQGTYTFFHLMPGAYSLLAKSGDTSVLDVTVEAGKAYYFFENPIMGFSKGHVRLTRQAEPLVQQEITGMFFSDWRPKAR